MLPFHFFFRNHYGIPSSSAAIPSHPLGYSCLGHVPLCPALLDNISNTSPSPIHIATAISPFPILHRSRTTTLPLPSLHRYSYPQFLHQGPESHPHPPPHRRPKLRPFPPPTTSTPTAPSSTPPISYFFTHSSVLFSFLLSLIKRHHLQFKSFF